MFFNLRCAAPNYTPLGDSIYIWCLDDTNFDSIEWIEYGKTFSSNIFKTIPYKISPVNINYTYTLEDDDVYTNTVTVNISKGENEVTLSTDKKYVVAFRQDRQYLFVNPDYGLGLTISGSNGNDGTATFTFAGLSHFSALKVDKEWIGYFYLDASENPAILLSDEYKPDEYVYRVLEDDKYTADIPADNGIYKVYEIRLKETFAGFPLDKDGYPVVDGITPNKQAIQVNRQASPDVPQYDIEDDKFYWTDEYSDVAGNSIYYYKENVSVNNYTVSAKNGAYIIDSTVVTDKLEYKNEERVNYNKYGLTVDDIKYTLTDYTGNTRYDWTLQNDYAINEKFYIPYSDTYQTLSFVINTNVMASDLEYDEIDQDFPLNTIEQLNDRQVLVVVGQLGQGWSSYGPGDVITIFNLLDTNGEEMNTVEIELY